MLSLDDDSLEKVCAWQRDSGPLEVCGFCAVDRLGRQHVLRLTNHAAEPDAFETSRSEERAALAAADERGWKIVAFLHTHPEDGADMSPRDALCFERDTLPWIIVGTPTSTPCQRAYLRRCCPDESRRAAARDG
jgi:proteasome lid subunit RPN8/RPN11